MTKKQYMTKLLLFVACTMFVLTGCVRRDEPELVSLQEGKAAASGEASAGTSSVSESVSGSESISESGQRTAKEAEKTAGKADGTVTVFVCGAVESPGVYVLPDGSRICDAVEAAGGFLEDADPSYLNQAEYVQDAQKLEIPTSEEAQELREQGASEDSQDSAVPEDNKQSGDGKVSINDAGVTELMQLPGIGEGKAKAIIEYREKNGRFGSLEDLMKVPGIKQASFDKLRDSIKL